MPGDRSSEDFGLKGNSERMLRLREDIALFAPATETVLIRGENGTGKEVAARAIHQLSTRADKLFLTINCAAIPETLLESELFGHEKGAFTGADRRRSGKFEQCNGGTLFLDEIGDMTPLTQAKILRLIQEQHFERVGGNETIQTDVRLIAATNRHLEEMIREGKFREDLYYRLNVLLLEIPPLRDRGDDVLVLAHHFLEREARTKEKAPAQFTEEAVRRLQDHDWPGNVRELENIVRRAVQLAPVTIHGTKVDVEHFRLPVPPSVPNKRHSPSLDAAPSVRPLADITSAALADDDPPTLGLRHGDDDCGRVAAYIIEELVAGFADYLRTNKGVKQLANYSDEHLISLFGLARRRSDNKNQLMAALYDRLKRTLDARRQELPPSSDTKRRSGRQTPPPNDD